MTTNRSDLIFLNESNQEQTEKLNTILGLSKDFYTVRDIFIYLPNEICPDSIRGYLSVDIYGIHWTSLGEQLTIQIVRSYPVTMGTNDNIYDAFISAAEYIKQLENTKYNKY